MCGTMAKVKIASAADEVSPSLPHNCRLSPRGVSVEQSGMHVVMAATNICTETKGLHHCHKVEARGGCATDG